MSEEKNKNAKEKNTSENTLIFIDTNIILDFYRYPKGSAVNSALKLIDDNHNKIITSTQVEMEYKKNRQKVFADSGGVKFPNEKEFKVPVILENLRPKKMINTDLRKIETQSKKLKAKIEKILKNPSKNDIVYQTMQKLFKGKSDLNLKRPNKLRFEIRDFAKKRFTLGYPPRKNSDTSIGDAINWEWIIHCAKSAPKKIKNVVIVSRDTDYGCNFKGKMIINDWLLQEFKDRVGRKKLTLTNKLMEGFTLAGIKVKSEIIKQENELLSEKNN